MESIFHANQMNCSYMTGTWVQTGYDPVPLSKKHHVNKRKASLRLRLEHNAKRYQMYFSNTRIIKLT